MSARKIAVVSVAAVLLLLLGALAGRLMLLSGGAFISAGGAGHGQMQHLTLTRAEELAHTATVKININTATAEELGELPGIGPALAGRIVEYRLEHGDFQTPQEIMAVRGIGEAVYAQVEDFIDISD